MPATDAPATTRVREVLAAAVEALGGEERPGQIADGRGGRATRWTTGEHLLVQAGTGTGKSLAYLVPALLHDQRVVVATATLALQHQLVERDIPRLVEAAGDVLREVDTSYAVLKGRSNYACLHRIREGVPDDQGALVEVPEGSLGKKVLELRAWAEEEAEDERQRRARPRAAAHRPRVAAGQRQPPRVPRRGASARSARSASPSAPARRRHRSHLIVTNHSLLAIDAIEGVPMIPDYDVVVIDEAHELSARVTQAATDELSRAEVERAAAPRRSGTSRATDGRRPRRRRRRAARRRSTTCRPGRIDAAARGARRRAGAGARRRPRLPLGVPQGADADGEADAGRTQATGVGAGGLRDRRADGRRLRRRRALADRGRRDRGRRRGSASRRSQVWGPMRDKLLTDKTVVLTCATLMLGGDFDAVATSVGLKPTERVDDSPSRGRRDRAATRRRRRLPWRGIDVGSPFDYGQQAILYVARHLPPPGRDGLGQAQLDEIVDAGRRRRGPHARAVLSAGAPPRPRPRRVRERLPHLTTLAQGEAQLPELARQFVERPAHLPVRHAQPVAGPRRPGRHLPAGAHRPDPVPAARRPADVARASAPPTGGRQRLHAGRRHPRRAAARPGHRPADPHHDRPGVVAILDPRLATARYGSFLRGQPAADVDDDRPRRRAQGAEAAGLLSRCEGQSGVRWEDEGMGSTFVVSDVHGHLADLRSVLREAAWSTRTTGGRVPTRAVGARRPRRPRAGRHRRDPVRPRRCRSRRPTRCGC